MVNFYGILIKELTRISHMLCKLYEKKSMFDFDYDFLIAFGELKKNLVFAPIIIKPDRGEKFEVIYDASGVKLLVKLG